VLDVSWLFEHSSELLQLAAPSSVILLVLSRWWEGRREFGRMKEMLFNEMAVNAKIIKDDLDLIKKGKNGFNEREDHAHVSHLHRLSYSGWTVLLTSGNLGKFSGKSLKKGMVSRIRDMYTHILLTDQQMAAREHILYGPLRLMTSHRNNGRPISWAEKELDVLDVVIEGNLQEIKKKISEINQELFKSVVLNV
jgi:hypothetical protein